MRLRTTLLLSIPLVMISSACSNSSARDTDGARTGSAAVVSEADRMFAENAAASGRMEVEHGQVAESRASDPAVKEYAAHLVSEHRAANDELMALLQQKQITVTDWSERRDHRGSVGSKDDATTATKTGGPPTGSPSPTGTTGASGTVATTGEARDRERAGMAHPWMQASGDEFDDGFVAAQIKAHEDAIALFDQQAKRGGDPELQAFASKHLPALREHLRQAQELQRQGNQKP